MDEIVKLRPNVAAVPVPKPRRPSRAEAEAAVRTLIAWTGDDPDREGLVDTSCRVASAYQELFAGCREDPGKWLEAEHTCMATRGVRKQGASTVITQFSGVFRDDPDEQSRFFNLLRGTH